MKPFLLVSFSCWLVCSGWCKPNDEQPNNDGNEIKYTDFVPRYRKMATDFIISKIDYREDVTVLHFRCVATGDKNSIHFFGVEHENAWLISTNQRSSNSAESLNRAAEVVNIRIDDKRQKKNLAPTEVMELKANKGEIVSCEIHFKTMPQYIKTINLIQGDKDKHGTARFACYDIMIKTQAGGMLGDKSQMQSNIQQFYKTIKSVNITSILEITSLEQDSIFESKERNHKEKMENESAQKILSSTEPIDYMPRMMVTIADLRCSERVILQNVYFEDQSAEFSKRVQAIKAINQIADYLVRYPDSKVALHGHTDIFGDPVVNLELSEKRVLAVQRVIIDRGIDRKRVLINYYGGQNPLPLYKNGGPMNRRVEAEIICVDK